MRVLHVVRDLDEESGGPSNSVPRLVKAVGGLGGDSVVVYEERGELSEAARGLPADCLFPVERRIWGFRYVVQSLESLWQRGGPIDVVHLHGLWNSLNHWCCRWARRKGVPALISPRGMLDEWSLRQKGFKKKLAMWLYQRRDLSSARVIHVTSGMEAGFVRKLGFLNRIEIVPNGVALPDKEPCEPESGGERICLFLSRIHEKKGVDNLIQAWKRIDPPGWRCLIVGPGEVGYIAALKRLRDDGGGCDSISFGAQVVGEEKWNLLRRADVLVLPSHSENFGNVVAEALACGIPVVTTMNTPWQELENHQCGWWIEDDLEVLVSTLKKVLCMERSDLRVMGAQGRQMILEEYSWISVGRRMCEVYASMS